MSYVYNDAFGRHVCNRNANLYTHTTAKYTYKSRFHSLRIECFFPLQSFDIFGYCARKTCIVGTH